MTTLAEKALEKYSITLQVNVAKRVLAVFHGIYPDMLEKKLIDYDTATIDTRGIMAIVKTLEWFEKHEDVIKSVVAREIAKKKPAGADAPPLNGAAA